MSVTPAAVLRAKRRSRLVNVLLSACVTLAIFGAAVVAASLVSYAVSPDKETTTSWWVGFAAAAAIFIPAVSFLILRAYPWEPRRWGFWIVLAVLFAVIPLIVLPWLVVTKRNWPTPTEEEGSAAEGGRNRAQGSAWIIAGAIVLAAIIIGGAVLAVASTSDRSGSGGGTSDGASSSSGSFGSYSSEEAYGAYWGSFSGCGQQSLEQLAATYSVPSRPESVARAFSLTVSGLSSGSQETEDAAYDGCFDALTMSPSEVQGYATCGSYTLDQLADLYATTPDSDAAARAVAAELGGGDETYRGCLAALEKFGTG